MRLPAQLREALVRPRGGLAIIVALFAILFMLGDEYSFGEFSYPHFTLGPAHTIVWQVIVAGALVSLLLLTALRAARNDVRAALRIAVVEAIVFTSFNLALFLRDGTARFVDVSYVFVYDRAWLVGSGAIARLVLIGLLVAGAKRGANHRGSSQREARCAVE